MGDCAGMFPQQKKGVPQRETAGDLTRPCSAIILPNKGCFEGKISIFPWNLIVFI
jgi:hypothetical protein